MPFTYDRLAFDGEYARGNVKDIYIILKCQQNQRDNHVNSAIDRFDFMETGGNSFYGTPNMREYQQRLIRLSISTQPCNCAAMTQQPDPLSPEFSDILERENMVWRALMAGDAHSDRDLLLPEFTGVYPSGITGCAGHVGQLKQGPSIKDFRLSETRAFAVGEDHVMLCYRADYRRVQATEEEAMYVSSLWQRDGDGWRNLFSQDTPIDSA